MKNTNSKLYDDFLNFMSNFKLPFPIVIKGSFSLFRNNKLLRMPNDIDISLPGEIDSLTTQEKWGKIISFFKIEKVILDTFFIKSVIINFNNTQINLECVTTQPMLLEHCTKYKENLYILNPDRAISAKIMQFFYLISNEISFNESKLLNCIGDILNSIEDKSLKNNLFSKFNKYLSQDLDANTFTWFFWWEQHFNLIIFQKRKILNEIQKININDELKTKFKLFILELLKIINPNLKNKVLCANRIISKKRKFIKILFEDDLNKTTILKDYFLIKRKNVHFKINIYNANKTINYFNNVDYRGNIFIVKNFHIFIQNLINFLKLNFGFEESEISNQKPINISFDIRNNWNSSNLIIKDINKENYLNNNFIDFNLDKKVNNDLNEFIIPFSNQNDNYKIIFSNIYYFIFLTLNLSDNNGFASQDL